MGMFEKAMRQIELYGRRGWSAAQNATLSRIITRDDWERKNRDLTRQERHVLAREWGRLNIQSVVRYVPNTPVFVHCHDCGWPVNPGRTHMLLGNDERQEASEDQMRRICHGVLHHMGLM